MVLELQISRGNEKDEKSTTGSFESNVHMSDAYSLREGEWLAEFGTIKSMTGLSNKQIPDILQRLQKLGKFGASKSESQWENICMLNGKLIWTDDLKDEKPKMMVVGDKPFADTVKKLEKIILPGDTKEEPEEDQGFDEWLDEIIGIISEVADATPEQLQKLGQSLNLIGKELEDSGLDEEVDSLVETIESDEEDEMIEQCIQEIKKGNKPLINFFAHLTGKADSEPEQKPEKVIETPVKPNESPIANQIIQEATEKISKTCPVNEQQRHTDAIVDMVQKMQLMSTEEIEELWDMWAGMQKKPAERPKPKLIPKKPKPEPALSDNDWEDIDESWEKDEKKYWKEIKGLKKELEEMKEIEEKLGDTPPSKSWGPNRDAVSPGSQQMSNQEIAYGCERHEDFLDYIFREIIESEPMDWLETQKRWEETWRKMGKEWQQQAMERRRKEQEIKSKWNLFYGLTGITPPWSKLNPREPEPWEPKL